MKVCSNDMFVARAVHAIAHAAWVFLRWHWCNGLLFRVLAVQDGRLSWKMLMRLLCLPTGAWTRLLKLKWLI